ncbi:MAG: methenyltetrahydromethanopterin cyclohydrolase [Candidatus Helarchaeota archaeon]
MVEISVNKTALKLVQEVMDKKNLYKVNVKKLTNGATVIDAGIEVSGGYLAGVKLGEICLGGLGVVNLTTTSFGDFVVPSVTVATDFPHIACLGSQFAGWRLNVKDEGYFAMLSGPARALKGGEKGLFEELQYKDNADVAVAVLEGRTLPNEKVMEFIATKCKVDVDKTYALIAPTASIAGCVQIAARVVEMGIHKLHELGYDPKKIAYGIGTTPIAPIAKSDTKAMGVTNDAIIAVGSVIYNITSEEEDNLVEIIEKVPSSTSKQYGKPFFQIFKEAGKDFYNIDPLLFAPAQITINDVRTGKTMMAGKLDVNLLKNSFGI